MDKGPDIVALSLVSPSLSSSWQRWGISFTVVSILHFILYAFYCFSDIYWLMTDANSDEDPHSHSDSILPSSSPSPFDASFNASSSDSVSFDALSAISAAAAGISNMESPSLYASARTSLMATCDLNVNVVIFYAGFNFFNFVLLGAWLFSFWVNQRLFMSREIGPEVQAILVRRKQVAKKVRSMTSYLLFLSSLHFIFSFPIISFTSFTSFTLFFLNNLLRSTHFYYSGFIYC